jgi:hypothetical protein
VLLLELLDKKDQIFSSPMLMRHIFCLFCLICISLIQLRDRNLFKLLFKLEKNKRESNSGEIQREHSEGEACRLMFTALEALGIETSSLSKMPKSAIEEKAKAALLASQTLASTEWMAEQLQMGHRSAVSQSKKWAKETKEGEMRLSKLS